jgi:hypothetical protein
LRPPCPWTEAPTVHTPSISAVRTGPATRLQPTSPSHSRFPPGRRRAHRQWLSCRRTIVAQTTRIT